ncbi:hypothetical protein BJY00DRAFT_315323 [Aspergillus carlsbadensis]|nr:hypothetical protein BJY00DRAFT_315323 [Aspergillus carlsbadensis]
MVQMTPCRLPQFNSGVSGLERPMSRRINPNTGDDARLVSAWNDCKLDGVIQATWGLVLRCYAGSDEVCFGYQYIDTNEVVGSREVASDTLKLTTVRLVLGDGDTAATLVEKVKGTKVTGALAVDDGRNAVGDGHLPYNTSVLIRSNMSNTQGAAASSIPTAMALTIPRECLIRLHVKVLQGNIRMFLEWRTDGMSTKRAEGIVALFQNLLNQVLSPERIPVRDFNFFTDLDWQRINDWNSPPPQVHDRCIHDIIRDQVVRRPHDEAICAWDGSLSFQQFDHQASRLAYHLQQQGVGSEMWYFVAVLAVLKAGGAFVPLDPSHPPARLQSLIKKVNAKLILCSEWHADRLLGLSEIVIPLSQTTFDRIRPAPVGFISSDEVNCTNAAYVIFTSGSTGEPKGTVVEHRAYCSSAMVHGPRLLIRPESRVLQFAAHTFDASLAESISPFMHGACVCVPSEQDRLNDIVGSIKRLRANYASLTPSFIEFIEPLMVPEIQTLVLAGEAMSETHRAKWSTINLVNGFGPTEASVTAAINSNVTATTDCRDIGLPLNTRCWIVNPDDHDQLVPVGAVGEMLLEGPTLARGYLDNPEKTAEAFIYDPKLLSRDSTAVQGRRRFYKTGDLVRYNSDSGSLTYIGRKDTQVKLHGQRVELGEIEASLNADPSVKHCVVFLPKEGYATGKLTAVLSLSSADEKHTRSSPLGLIPVEVHSQSVARLREQLTGRLPSYMVPALWISVEDMPFLPSRKLDRKSIINWVTGLDKDPYRTTTINKPAPFQEQATTEAERHLIQIWSRLLNIPSDEVPLNESFLKLGGDSIAAMTCMNQCKKHGIAVTVQDILKSTSILELASRAKQMPNYACTTHLEKVEEPFDLSPIQTLHFKVRQEGQGNFNQSILTRLNRRIEPTTFRQAIETLMLRHSMLRARFEKSSVDGSIRQRITNEVETSYGWRHHQVVLESGIDQAIATSQSSLSCFSGPLLAVDLFDVSGGKQMLSMVAHHLVVDIVSWRVILEDLEEILGSPSVSPQLNSSLPYQTWLRLQSEHRKISEQEQAELETLSPPDFAYWGLEKSQILYGDVRCASFSLDERETSILMSDCHNSLRTELVDLLLAAMHFSFSQTFGDRPLPVIYNEGHGREPWDASIDISRTVGWFTTLYPIVIDRPSHPIDAVVRVKDRRREVSDNGRSAFARRAPSHDCPMEVNLNYLGQHKDLQRADGLFQLANQMAGETRQGGGSADFGRETPRFSLFEVSAVVVGGCLRFVFSFSASMKHQERVCDWVQACKQTLQSFTIQLPTLKPRLTIGDVPLMAMSYKELSVLEMQKLPRYGVSSIEDVEDIYPCSKMQQGVLLSQARDPSLYAVSGTWEVQAAPGAPKPDLQQLVKAWDAVVDHHAMLRTVFATGLSRRHPFSHIVLKKYTSAPVLLQCTRDEDILATLETQPPPDYRATRPPHRLTLCQVSTGKIVCKLELSHAAMDGSSISLLLRDLQQAYTGSLNATRRPLFKHYIEHLKSLSAGKGLEHWCGYLSGLQPCHLPSDISPAQGRKRLSSMRLNFERFSELQSFCANNNITVANAFNAAWALTLAHFCNADEICFSYTASLRDKPVGEIESVIGPVMNLLVCRLKVGSRKVLDILRQIQDDCMENYPHRDVSLIDIQHAMRTSRISLFNTGVSYRKLPPAGESAYPIEFKGVGLIHDPAEVSVYINVEATDSNAQVELNYWNNWLSDTQARNVADAFLQSLTDITTDPMPAMNESASPQDIHQICQWNDLEMPEPTLAIHAEIETQTRKMPHSIALATEQQELSYAELDDLSSALASYLVNLGVLPGTTVPIAFEQSQSMWAILSVLAIWKAGGSCLPLPSGPLHEELEAWMLAADLQVALACSIQSAVLEELAPYVIPVTEEFLASLQTQTGTSHQVQMADNAFVVFSKDSTNGLVVNHAAVASSCHSFADALGFDVSTRILESAHPSCYEFLLQVFSTLARGGCVCIPSEITLDDLSKSISNLGVTAISMDSAVAEYASVVDTPSLRQVVITGDSMPLMTDGKRFSHAVTHAFYGTVECSPACLRLSTSDHNLMERMPGTKAWIVDPSDHNILLPIGATGELVLESLGAVQGQLIDTAGGDIFIDDAAWFPLVCAKGGSTARRVFKTGIVAQYGDGGSLIYRGLTGAPIPPEPLQESTGPQSSTVLSDTDYWKTYLSEVEPCLFPAFCDESDHCDKTSLARLVLEDVGDLRESCQTHNVSASAVLQLTWGLVLRCFTGLNDACFGVSDYDQKEPLPLRFSLRDNRQVIEALKDIHAALEEGENHRIPLSEVIRTCTNPESELFNTMFHLNDRVASSSRRGSHMRGIGKEAYAVTVRAELSKRTCVVEFIFLRNALSETYADALATCFEHVLGQIKRMMASQSIIGDIDFLDEFTGGLISDWNRELPAPFERCVHELIAEQTRRLPDSAQAICAWDGNFTYTKLDTLATRLSQHLQRLGVGPEVFVALCFTKSAWAIVAQLAVLKAGGAFASLDPAHPESRLRGLVADLGAKIILTSSTCLDKVSNLGAQPLVVSRSSIDQLPTTSRSLVTQQVSPSSAAYAIFTSGTTGMPKATVIQHTALSTTSIYLAKVLGLDSTTRALQFSSYTFDVSVLDIHGTLINGGCICVPSDHERVNDLAGAIRRMRVTHLNGTPGIANMLDPKAIPSLVTMSTGGEKMSPGHIERWSDRCVINAYGPSETTIIATASVKVDREGNFSPESRASIGKPVCSRAWVVDPYNPQRLLPVGATGELVLEGCNVAKGYLNNKEKTERAFMENPSWSAHVSIKSIMIVQERMYRTGDLVRYNPDGTLTFISRMDTQVKLNGQRIELEEIEMQCLQALPQDSQLVVEVVAPKGKTVRSLAVFFCLPSYGAESASDELLLEPTPSRSVTAAQIWEAARDSLPQYMVPSLFFPVQQLPCTTSAKIDRRRLRATVEELHNDRLQLYTLTTLSAVPFEEDLGSPETTSRSASPVSTADLHSHSSASSVAAMEDTQSCLGEPTLDSKLRHLWGEILGVDPTSLRSDDSFFALGGDSFTAMSLVSAAQAEGLTLSVAEIFQSPALKDMVGCCQTKDAPAETLQAPSPFSLLPDHTNLDELLDEVSSTCQVTKASILDIHPCSALQEGLITASIQQPGAYVANPVFSLSNEVDIPTFKQAWQKTVDEIEILRSRILHTATANFVQVILQSSPIFWGLGAEDVAAQVGGSLTGYTITETGSVRLFTWYIHHALYDGWSVPLVLQRVQENYKICDSGSVASLSDTMVPYSLFIDHLQKRDIAASDDFWRTYLSGVSSPAFPASKSALPPKINASSRQYCLTKITPVRKDITLPAVIRAAWAMVLSLHTESGDVCFGETLMGRNIELPSATRIAGPLLTTVPCRIAVASSTKINEYLDRIHQAAASMIPHQHTGLQQIRKLSEYANAGCDFQNLLVIQNGVHELDSRIWTPESTETKQEFFTYPLTIECRLADAIDITAYFDEQVIPAWRVGRLLGQLKVILIQLADTSPSDASCLSDLRVVSAEDEQDFSKWNRQTLPCVDRTIHDLVNDQRLLRPNAPAVASWDGDLSYQELLDTASTFASHLSMLGVGPEILVPMCMDKSVWMIVTIMSILMAGGAFVPLDPAHPTSRHEEILEETGAKIVLCTPKYSSRSGPIQRTANSANIAYSIFTSGSTGRPKGIIIEHRAFASSTMAYGPIIHLKPGIRVFQFASLTFDAAVMEILGTLIYGGCVCIPSDEERLNDISGAIRRLDASWLFCTPSLASIMEPASVPSLKVIVCGGEMMSHEAMTKWSDKVHFINAYGPTETSVYASFNPDIGKNLNPANIGHTIPSTKAWIVDPDNHDRLYPIGVVGELALEGPVLAREYLKNPEKTAKAFITNPKWTQIRPGQPSRRIYLTGDLARFAGDGSLEYVGRKDHQVKIHGQRMELGEIEYRLHEHPHVRHVVVILPKTGRLQKRLVSVLSLNSLSAETSLISASNCSLVDEESMLRQGMPELLEVQSSLEGQLPPYMVPQTWAVVKTLPMLVSGKIDRKKITAWVESVDDATFDRIMGDYDKIKRGEVALPKAKAMPVPKQNDTETVLREILSRVLNLPTEKVNMGRSFTSLGGDSITGMAIVSHARKKGITLSLHRILQASSVQLLVEEAEAGVKKINKIEQPNVWFELSAIQKFYFEYATKFKGSARFNQSVTLRLPRRVEPGIIENGLNAIVSKHAMLRARFRQCNGKCEQRMLTAAEDSYKLQVTTLQHENDLKRMIAVTQNLIDIQNGPIFAASLFEVPGVDQILFLVASHLCIDMVSWRLILQDLEEFLKSGSLSSEPQLSFQTWCSMQAKHCEADDYQSHLPFSIPAADPAYWGMDGASNQYGDVRIKKFSLGAKETALALDKCHTRLRTEPLDLFLAVVMHSFRRTFTDRHLPTVYNETHGRQPWDSNIDLSGTVGWFTSICPLHLQLSSDDIIETLRMVKETRRKTVNSGSSFFAQKVLVPEKQPSSSPITLPVEVVFNYLGKLQQLEREDSPFQHYGNVYDENDFIVAGDMGPQTARFALFEISAIVIQDQLQFSFTFNKNIRQQAQITSWISECEMTLYEALDILRQDSHLEVMPSDYPLLSISQTGLQTLFSNTLAKLGVHSRDEVEDVYPCSSMQEGILFSQLRDSSAYMLHTIFNVRDNRHNQPINIPRLRKAWQMIVNRHSILRTAFVDSNSKNGSFDQVVLRHLHANLVELECEDSNVLQQLNKVSLEETNRKRALKELHQLSVCRTSNGSVMMKLEMNHAIIDGASIGNLLSDFSKAYERQLSTQPGPSYRDYIAHMLSHPRKEGNTFWAQHLQGLQPCHLPPSGHGPRELKSVKMDFHRFSELRQLGQRESVTVANLVLAAWSLVLREFTGSQDVCFGYLSAGRDVPVQGIQDAVGIFINMLCCRVQFVHGQSFADIYKSVQADFFRSIPYQTCSLATVQNELGLGSQMLFNTALSIQNQMPSASSQDDALSFDIQEAHDPSEFPVTVNVVTAQGSEGILLRYWSDAISTDNANRLVAGIAKVLAMFIDGSSRSISTLDPSIPKELSKQEVGQSQSHTSLRRRSSVRSRSPRLSTSNPQIQHQIDERVNEILSQLLNPDQLAAILRTDTARPDHEAETTPDDHDSLNPRPISPISRMASIRRRFSTISRMSRRRVSMDLERKLLLLWSIALDIPVNMVDKQDSFFRVGGDSIKAMKMASAAREEGLVLTVADVFRNPIFEDMLSVICSTNIVHAAPSISDVSIDEEDAPIQQVGEIIGEVASSGTVSRQSLELAKYSNVATDFVQADICPKIGFFKGGISDVLPVTDFQALSLTAQLFESRWMLNYFYLDGEGQLDMKRLRESCARVVDAFDILRTVFVCSGESFYQVILKKVRPTLVIYETQTDLDTFTASLQQRDRDQGLCQGEQFVQFAVAKRRGTNQHRILIRLSHAQYDGMCISKIFDALKQGYEGGTLAPSMSYANYMRLLPSSITPEHYQYWTNLLKGSRMTEVISRDYPNTYQTMGSYAEVNTTISIAQNSTIGNITVGTLVQAAWALALSRLSADSDVVFGLTINGRNASIPGVQDTVGPCLNMIPVRVIFGNKWSGLDLIRYLQDQLVATMPYEALGFREIIQRCTDWPCSTYFSTAVLHQNVDYEGHMDLDNQQYRVGGAGVIDNLADLTLVSRSVGTNQVSLSLGYSSKGPITEAFASRVLQLVCDAMITLTSSPTAQLPSPNTLRSLPPQTLPDLPRATDQQALASQLKTQNISDILVHSAILSRTWQQVLPSMYASQKTFQLDTSFYDLGGDLFALGQATWLLQQEGYQVRIEDLLDRPTFLGHMAVMAQDVLGQSVQDDAADTSQEEVSNPQPMEKSEKKVRWKKAFGLIGKFSKRESGST